MEPITSLLDAFIKLVDRIVNLDKARLQDRKDLFNEIIKPLFEEVEPVALNYMEFFQKAKKTIIESPPEDLQKTGLDIEQGRNAMIIARVKVREMANQIERQFKDKEIVEFASSIDNFFYDASEYPARLRSFGASLLYIINRADLDNQGKDKVVSYINRVSRMLELSWADIVSSYEKVRIYSVSSAKFIRKPQE